MDDSEGRAIREGALQGGEAARDAFSRLWKAYYPRFCVFASAFRGLPAGDREDEAANALLDAFGALGRYDPSRPFAPWIFRIARNRFATAARRAARLSSVRVGPGGKDEPVVDPPDGFDHAGRTVERDLAERCRRAMAALPETDRRIAFLCFSEGLDSRETGRALGMPAGTVRWRLSRIRERVRAEVGEDSP